MQVNLNIVRRTQTFFVVMTIILASPVAAQRSNLPENWVLDKGDSACAITNSYPIKNKRFIYVVNDREGQVLIRMYDGEWSFVDKQNYSIQFKFENASIDAAAKGDSFTDGSRGFTARTDITWLGALAGSKLVSIKNNDAIFASIDVKGANIAVDALRKCASLLIAFSAKPIDMQNWIRSDDYMLEAIATGLDGTVTYRLSINAQGKPKKCNIVRSSGSNQIDDRTCFLLVSRARFEPARTITGIAVESDFQQRVTWRLN
jgi:TonB family protein